MPVELFRPWITVLVLISWVWSICGVPEARPQPTVPDWVLEKPVGVVVVKLYAVPTGLVK